MSPFNCITAIAFLLLSVVRGFSDATSITAPCSLESFDRTVGHVSDNNTTYDAQGTPLYDGTIKLSFTCNVTAVPKGVINGCWEYYGVESVRSVDTSVEESLPPDKASKRAFTTVEKVELVLYLFVLLGLGSLIPKLRRQIRRDEEEKKQAEAAAMLKLRSQWREEWEREREDAQRYHDGGEKQVKDAYRQVYC